MRALTAAQTAVRAKGVQADSYRVQIKDSGGTWRDLTTYPGFNAVQSISVSDSVGSPHMSAEVELTREFFKLSLSPYMSGSALNRGFVHTATPVALIALKREFKIDVAITAMGHAPSSGDWFTVFHGRVDFVNPANGKTMRFGGRDLAGRIADQQIKTERIYALAEVGGLAVALRPWAAGMVVAVGDYMLPASNSDSDSGVNKFFVCDTAGTTGNTEPTWSTGANITDGSARWDYVGAPTVLGLPVEEVQQNLLDVNKAAGDSSVTLYVPTSPSWAITQFLQGRGRNFQAIRALAQQIGWDCRMKWRAATSQFELTLFEPERAKVTPDATFAANAYDEPTKLETTIENIRNAWRVIYSDTADLWPDGSAKRKVVEVSDATSITDYGELWAEIAESSSSNINTSVEANKLANAALSDCARPTADFTVKTRQAFPWVELGDLYSFGADMRRFDASQSFAVTGWKLTGKSGKLSTEFSMRGKPALSAWAWITQTIVMPFAQGETQPPPKFTHYPGGKNPRPATLKVPGGVGVSMGADSISPSSSGDTEYEVHVSQSSGFTPASGTLKGVIKGQIATIQELQPGSPHYGKIVPRVRERSGRLARGQPGAQFSFTPAFAKAGLLDRLAVPGLPNADFEDNFDTSETPAKPPDHWSMLSGTWGSSSDVSQETDLVHGKVIAFRQTATLAATLTSDAFRIDLTEDPEFVLAAWVKTTGTQAAGRNLHWIVDFFSDPAGLSSLGTVDLVTPYNVAAANTWVKWTGYALAPTGAVYASVRMYKEAASSAYGFNVGSIALLPARQRVKRLEIVGPSTDGAWTSKTDGQLWLTDEDQEAAGLLMGYRYNFGVTEYGLIQAYSGGGANLLLNPAGGAVVIGTTTLPSGPRLYVEGLDRWNPWAAQVYGDFYIGTASYGIKMGIATGGGGAGAATLQAQGGVNQLNIGAGATQAHAQAITITNGLVAMANAAITHIRANRASAQSIGNGADVLMIFDTEQFDTKSEYNNTTGRATIATAGFYRVEAAVLFEQFAAAVGTVWQITLYKNGAAVSLGARPVAETTLNSYRHVMIADTIQLAASDIIDVRVFQNTGGTRTTFGGATWNYLNIHRIL